MAGYLGGASALAFGLLVAGGAAAQDLTQDITGSGPITQGQTEAVFGGNNAAEDGAAVTDGNAITSGDGTAVASGASTANNVLIDNGNAVATSGSTAAAGGGLVGGDGVALGATTGAPSNTVVGGDGVALQIGDADESLETPGSNVVLGNGNEAVASVGAGSVDDDGNASAGAVVGGSGVAISAATVDGFEFEDDGGGIASRGSAAQVGTGNVAAAAAGNSEDGNGRAASVVGNGIAISTSLDLETEEGENGDAVTDGSIVQSSGSNTGAAAGRLISVDEGEVGRGAAAVDGGIAVIGADIDEEIHDVNGPNGDGETEAPGTNLVIGTGNRAAAASGSDGDGSAAVGAGGTAISAQDVSADDPATAVFGSTNLVAASDLVQSVGEPQGITVDGSSTNLLSTGANSNGNFGTLTGANVGGANSGIVNQGAPSAISSANSF